MDAIGKLANVIAGRLLDGTRAVPVERLIAEELRAANIIIPPAPPLPGSLWEHRETGERRFVTIQGNSKAIVHYRKLEVMSHGSIADWNAWAANAVCLCEGRDPSTATK